MTKPFSFSWSKLKNYETCPLRHYEVDIAKLFKEDESEALTWGNEVHKAAELYLKNGKALPAGMPVLQSWLERLDAANYDQKLVEQNLAITKKFEPCGYWDTKAWFRSKVDFLGIKKPVALAIDWKTGKILEETQQLALMAACCFAHFPDIQKIRTEFAWLKEGPGVSTRQDFSRDRMISMWASIWPRVAALENAYNTKDYPAKPGNLCAKWCVVTSCKHNGRYF